MKVYLVLVLAAFVVISEEQVVVNNTDMIAVLQGWKKIVDPFNTECMCKSGVTQDVLDRLWGQGETDNPCLKCAMKCWAQTLKFMSSTGVIDPVKYVKAVDGLDIAIARKCGSIPGVDICQKTYELFVCTYRHVVGLEPFPSISNDYNSVPYVLDYGK